MPPTMKVTLPWKVWVILTLIGANLLFFGYYRSSRKVDPYRLASTGHVIAVQLEYYKEQSGSFPEHLEDAVALEVLRYRDWDYTRRDKEACVFSHRTGAREEKVEVRLGEHVFAREGAYVVRGDEEEEVGWVRLTKEERRAKAKAKAKEREELEV